MAYCLRKSVGPFSAGTRIAVLGHNDDRTTTVEVRVPEPNKNKGYNYSFEDLVFDIDFGEIVQLRNRIDEVSSVSRSDRRAFLRQLFAKTQVS